MHDLGKHKVFFNWRKTTINKQTFCSQSYLQWCHLARCVNFRARRTNYFLDRRRAFREGSETSESPSGLLHCLPNLTERMFRLPNSATKLRHENLQRKRNGKSWIWWKQTELFSKKRRRFEMRKRDVDFGRFRLKERGRRKVGETEEWRWNTAKKEI